MAFRTGKDGRLLLSATPVKVKKWTLDPQPDAFDVTNSESGVPTEYQTGHIDYTATVELHYEAASSPFVAFVPGGTVTNVKFIVDGSAGLVFWLFTTGTVLGTPHESEARGMQTVTVTLKLGGTVTTPAT
jgi:hypothetical protein